MASVDTKKTLREVLIDLVRDGLLDDDGLSTIERHLSRLASRDREPWFVKLFLAIGAWIAAIFFLFFLEIAGLIDDTPTTLLTWGLVFLVSAITVRRMGENVFLTQLALVISGLGQAFLIVGSAQLSNSDHAFALAAIASVVLSLVLYKVYPDDLHRFLSCLASAGLITAWILEREAWDLIHLETLIEVVILGIVFLYHSERLLLRPLGYAMAVSLPANLFLVLLPDGIGEAPWWPANLVLAIAIVWLFQWIAGGWNHLHHEPLMIAVLATVGLATFTTPGLLAALGLAVLGYARNDRYLLAIGIAFFPIFIVVSYYEWQMTLLAKSWVMIGSGAILLLARWYLSTRRWAKESL
jgi:hypothetical protein